MFLIKKKNKKILSNPRTLNILEISDKLDIIPIINNCESYTTIIDPYSPKCQYPPYKEGFKYWIEKMKDLNLIKHKSLFAKYKQNSNQRILKSYSYKPLRKSI